MNDAKLRLTSLQIQLINLKKLLKKKGKEMIPCLHFNLRKKERDDLYWTEIYSHTSEALTVFSPGTGAGCRLPADEPYGRQKDAREPPTAPTDRERGGHTHVRENLQI